ncbi:YggS family pyridoxal phosphate-dependent enzyme [Aliikangiella maris]|uniref:Pyridoxal phosphate homeostasis protein n=2 Tax=Aliikangiella maris TaxID=3162458 RepID=A0ABV2BYY0_9GAMM
MTIADQIRQVRSNIEHYCQQANRSSDAVKLLAVSKTHPANAIQEAYESGITEFGESYLQEAIDKIKHLQNLPVIWHFIGPLQSNKTRPVAEHFDWVQSIDKPKLLERLNQQRPAGMRPLQVCLQANLFNEPQKRGASRAELLELLAIADSLPNIQLRGLMVIPPAQADLNKQREQFAYVNQVYQQLQQNYPAMDTLSMGMSSDIQAAIENQSNMVRVGTGIFGARQEIKK